jgi:hypothetical protein
MKHKKYITFKTNQDKIKKSSQKTYNYGNQDAESHILDVITTLPPANADPLVQKPANVSVFTEIKTVDT